MAVGHLTYKNIAPKLRAKSLRQAEDSLKAQLNSPETTSEKATAIKARLGVLQQWAIGGLAVDDPPASARVNPKNHAPVEPPQPFGGKAPITPPGQP